MLQKNLFLCQFELVKFNGFHNIEVNLATLWFCQYYQIKNSGVCLILYHYDIMESVDMYVGLFICDRGIYMCNICVQVIYVRQISLLYIW